MCGKCNTSRNTIEPGSLLIIHKRDGSDFLPWGPRPYNARIESLYGYWKFYEKGYTFLNSFWEGIGLFKVKDNELLNIAVVYNQFGCAFLTRSSKGTIIEQAHHRMPVILEKPRDFITTGNIVEIDYNRLIRVA